MTAIVGVLNRHGVAIAADSAVTMGNTHKVINCANKIFTLSKYHPVAVMTYNNASFMGVPWDIIIKLYRKELGEKSFPFLKDYVNSFIEFLHKHHFFCDEQSQHEFLEVLMCSFYEISRTIVSNNEGIAVQYVTNEQLNKNLRDSMESNKKSTFYCPDFSTLSYENFKKYAQKDLNKIKKNLHLTDVDLFTESFYYYLGIAIPTSLYTGLVFVGYGEDEIFPSLIPINVSIGFDNYLKYYIDKSKVSEISEHGTNSEVVPFAQEDVTRTILTGINPSFEGIIYNVIKKNIKKFSKNILSILDSREGNEDLSSAIKNLDLDNIVNETALNIKKEMNYSYSLPLLNTVALLDKEDMANMAESFISLTSLVRRMQPGEETVGGPVDVAVISKGDGFVWINRKHYFKPEFNSSFFKNYFK